MRLIPKQLTAWGKLRPSDLMRSDNIGFEQGYYPEVDNHSLTYDDTSLLYPINQTIGNLIGAGMNYWLENEPTSYNFFNKVDDNPYLTYGVADISVGPPTKGAFERSIGGRAGHLGQQATTKNVSSLRGPKTSNAWDNLEATGSVQGERTAGGMYIDKNGFTLTRGNIGRPSVTRSGNITDIALKTEKRGIGASKVTKGKRQSVGLNGRERGRVSKDNISTFWTLKDPVISNNPTSNLIRSFLANYRMKFKSYDMAEADLRNRILHSSSNVERNELNLQLNILRKRRIASMKDFRNHKYYDGSLN